MNPTVTVANRLRKFNANKSLWNNARCSEINNFFLTAQRHPLSYSNRTNLNAAARLLCNGPTFNEQQAEQLTDYLQRMQTTIVDTQICLPNQFDVCLNLDRIWEFTYVLRSGNNFEQLDLSAVQPTMYVPCAVQIFSFLIKLLCIAVRGIQCNFHLFENIFHFQKR